MPQKVNESHQLAALLLAQGWHPDLQSHPGKILQLPRSVSRSTLAHPWPQASASSCLSYDCRGLLKDEWGLSCVTEIILFTAAVALLKQRCCCTALSPPSPQETRKMIPAQTSNKNDVAITKLTNLLQSLELYCRRKKEAKLCLLAALESF